MQNVKPQEPVITVFRKISNNGNRCWYFCNGVPHDMSEALAIKEAARGAVRIKTVENA